MKTNNLHIKELRKTSSICPTQWEGKTGNGDQIYIRYRWGNLSVKKGKTMSDIMTGNGEKLYEEQVGDDIDGGMETEKMLEHTGITVEEVVR